MTLDQSDERWIRAMVEILEAKIQITANDNEAVNKRVDRVFSDVETRLRVMERWQGEQVGFTKGQAVIYAIAIMILSIVLGKVADILMSGA